MSRRHYEVRAIFDRDLTMQEIMETGEHTTRHIVGWRLVYMDPHIGAIEEMSFQIMGEENRHEVELICVRLNSLIEFI